MIGIYCIENLKSGKKYIGKSLNIEARWREHKHFLRHGTHGNRHLQSSWNKYGEESFKFYVVQESTREQIDELEKVWIEKLNTYNEGYNLTKGGDGQCGRYLTEEQKKHLSEINMGEKNPNYGLKRSEETRRLMSKAMRHKRRPMTEEHKKKISEGCKGVDHSTQNKSVLWIETNQIFKSVSEASEQTGYSVSGISKVCLGKRNKIYNQHFIFI